MGRDWVGSTSFPVMREKCGMSSWSFEGGGSWRARTSLKLLIHWVPHAGAPSAGAVRASHNSYGVTIGLK